GGRQAGQLTEGLGSIAGDGQAAGQCCTPQQGRISGRVCGGEQEQLLCLVVERLRGAKKARFDAIWTRGVIAAGEAADIPPRWETDDSQRVPCRFGNQPSPDSRIKPDAHNVVEQGSGGVRRQTPELQEGNLRKIRWDLTSREDHADRLSVEAAAD